MKKIVFIMTFSPKYLQFENQPRPKFCWNNSRGEWLGIWGLDWGDLMLKALVDYCPEYECEVWQPDLRADKIYTAHLQAGLVHRNFPAILKKTFRRHRYYEELYSESMIEYVKKYDDNESVFMIPTYVYYKWLDNLIKSVGRAKLLYYNFLHPALMLPKSLDTLNPVKALNRVLINKQKLKWLKRIDNLFTGYIDPEILAGIKSINPGIALYRRTFGIETDFWNRDKTRDQARELLNIPANQYVIVLSQRLVPEYQVDKFIEAISAVQVDRDFCCYITGHGLKDYEKYLKDLVSKFHLNDKIKFVGFISDKVLRDYLIAADLFATVPRLFSGSGGAVKAMALEIPVLHVSISGTYEFLKDHNAGVYVDPTDYQQWTKTIQDLINGMEIKTIPRIDVVEYFSWKKTASQLKNALENLK